MEKSGIEIHELMEFMNTPIKQYETGTKEPVFDDDSTIEFRNVSFKYPGSDAYALKNMSIKMRANEKLCIVGANGSGKTTFIKLLTRLYFPTEGEILLNGININEYDYEKYQRLFSPVFQDYSLYTLPLRDNIALSNEQDEERIIELCKKCGLSYLLEKLPNGINTSVYKNFDGEGFEPSGGEGQRIAIARALYHCSSICLLDEPTAALDPVSEYDIYTQFNSMITNKCAVLITHRLSAVQLADKVAVFEKGQLVEYGTHTELHAKGGIYTEMFDKQAQFYRNDPTGDDASE
jgi:ATP-binding cassette subfamily B protein/ATP-binding cassette subfamily C protein